MHGNAQNADGVKETDIKLTRQLQAADSRLTV